MLLFSKHSDCKADKCLLNLGIAKFAFLSSCRMIELGNTVPQLGSCFEVFALSISSTIFLGVLVDASSVSTSRIK